MRTESIKWYNECLESLFRGKQNSWVYSKVIEFSKASSVKSKEETIMDTKFKFRALLDYTMDVFTGDRMENKSYQLPFAMYYVAKSMFGESVAAIASEAIMSVANWDYRVGSNLLRFILFDDNPEETFLEKMTIFFMALEETKALEDTHMVARKGISLAEFYSELVEEIERVDYECVKRMLEGIRSSNKRYYLAYNHALWKAYEYCVPEHLRNFYAKFEKDKSRYSHEGLDETLTDFIKMDMYEYINKGYVGSYSPFWIFGSMQYKQNIDFIISRKHMVEFSAVWIHYLSIKSTEIGQDIETSDSEKIQIPKDNIIELQGWGRLVHKDRKEREYGI